MEERSKSHTNGAGEAIQPGQPKRREKEEKQIRRANREGKTRGGVRTRTQGGRRKRSEGTPLTRL